MLAIHHSCSPLHTSNKDTTGEDTSDPTPEQRGEKPSETCTNAAKARKPNKKGRKKNNNNNKKKRKTQTQDAVPHKRFDFAKNEMIALALSICVIACLVCLMNFLKASQ